MRAAATVIDGKRVRARVVALTALVAVAVPAAGCGSSGLGVASLSTPARPGRHATAPRPGVGGVRFVGGAPSPQQRAQAGIAGLEFSRCMRAHGVPQFPDPPSPSSGAIGFSFVRAGFDPAAPLFRTAQRVCVSFLTRRRGGIG